MHVTKTVRFDWSAAFKSFWYKKLAPNRAVFYLVQASDTKPHEQHNFASPGRTYPTIANSSRT